MAEKQDAKYVHHWEFQAEIYALDFKSRRTLEEAAEVEKIDSLGIQNSTGSSDWNYPLDLARRNNLFGVSGTQTNHQQSFQKNKK